VVAAIDPDIAEEAAELVQIDYEPLGAVFDIREAIKEDAPRLRGENAIDGPNGEKFYNIAGETHQHIGDVEKGFAESDVIVENTYYVPRVHHCYMQPNVCVAEVDNAGNVTVWTCTQGTFSIRSGIASALGIPLKNINVIGATMGGGFGAKFDTIVHPHAVLLSQKTGRPVKIALTRKEEFMFGYPAPGCLIHLKTGAKKDGTILARQALGFWDGGSAWSTIKVRNIYKIPNVKVDGYNVHTNKPRTTAYRAPGTPQPTYVGEAQMDELAKELNIDPVELRLKNMLDAGDTRPGGGTIGEVAYKQTLRAVAEAAGWKKREPGKHRGWGVAIGEWTHGSGPGGIMVSIHEDGSVHVFHGFMDITGTDTAAAQIVAEVLGVSYEDVSMTRGDTKSAPYTAGSGGSLVTFSMGNTAKLAAEDTKRRMLELAAEKLEADVSDLELKDKTITVISSPEKSVSLAELGAHALSETGGPIVGKGTFARQPTNSCVSAQIAQVEVDPDTGDIKVLKLCVAQDVGFAINPMAVEGQIEGGMTQGLSWGLWEEMLYDENGNLNPGYTDYRLPTAADMCAIVTVLVEEVPAPHGPYGAKGVGEPPITPTMAAIANAIADATGVRVTELPITPEKIVKALEA